MVRVIALLAFVVLVTAYAACSGQMFPHEQGIYFPGPPVKAEP